MNLFELSAKISVDDTNFKKSMENAQKVSKNVATAIKNLQSPLDRAKSGFNAIAHPVETVKANIEKLKNATEAIRHPIETFKNKVADASTALETKRNKLSTLAAGYDAAKKKVADITKEFNKSAKESGTSSQKTQELAKKLNEAEKEAEEAKKELDAYSASVSKAGKNSDSASKGVGNFASKLGKGLATAGKVAGAALGVAAAGVTALTTQAVNSFAEYEQLAGGAQKIFDQMDYSKIATDANNAYKELGLSANQYLAVINDVGATFAATMGDEAGYETAKTGLKAISDYASGTGKSVDELSEKYTLITRSTSSYQSIADQFSGILPATSKGFLEQAQAAGFLSDSYKELTQVPIDEYQAAVSQMLQQGVADLGLANNTVNEAFSTISGSLAMAKGAWSNLVTGLANDSADLDVLVGNFVASAGAVAENILPVVETALVGVSSLIEQIGPLIAETLPGIITDMLPSLLSAAVSIVGALISGITEALPSLYELITNMVFSIAQFISEGLPQLLSQGGEIISNLQAGFDENKPSLLNAVLALISNILILIVESFPSLVKNGSQIISQMLNGFLANAPNLISSAGQLMAQLLEQILSALPGMLESGFALIGELATGLANNIPAIVSSAASVIAQLLATILSHLPDLLASGISLIGELVAGLIQSIPTVVASIPQIISSITDEFANFDWLAIGSDIISGIANGITSGLGVIADAARSAASQALNAAKEFLGIKSPSRRFRYEVGKQISAGMALGVEDNEKMVVRAVDGVSKKILEGSDFGVGEIPLNIKYGTYGGNEEFGGSAFKGVSVVQNIYSEAKTAADLMQEAIYQQEMAVMFGV